MKRTDSKLVLLLKNIFSKVLIDKETLNRTTFSFFQKYAVAKSPLVTAENSSKSINGNNLEEMLRTFKADVKNLSKMGTKMHVLHKIESRQPLYDRTVELVADLSKTYTAVEQLKLIKDLTEFLIQHPEFRHVAIKEGVLRILTNIRETNKDSEMQIALRVAFSSLGYSDPLKSWGIRILSIDGGGVRGLIAIEILKKLEEFTNHKAYELFDYICGVSTGAIITCSLGAYQRDLDSVQFYYKEVSNKIFSQNVFLGTGNLVWSHGYYDTDLWEKMIKKYFGEYIRLIDTARNPLTPKLATISAIVNKSSLSPYVFRNYSLPGEAVPRYYGSCEHYVWQAIRASAAAPTYFHEFKLGNFLHQDGAIMANNPTSIAIHEAKQLWPYESLQCVLSLGTGRFRKPEFTFSQIPENLKDSNVSSWTNKLYKLLESATDTEGVNTILKDLLPNDVYYRINPSLTEVINMTEIRPEKLKQLEQDVQMYIRRNEDKLREIARTLTQPRGRIQRLNDWVTLQKQLFDI